jgi:hypothetical protein
LFKFSVCFLLTVPFIWRTFDILTVISFLFWHEVQQIWVSECEAKNDLSKNLPNVNGTGTCHDA